jgi:hypothetical protein
MGNLMFKPLGPWNAWIALSAQAARMYWEAQAVMLLRSMRIAKGGARAEAEAQRMITEKVAALAEAQIAAAAATLKGSKKHRVAKKALPLVDVGTEDRVCQKRTFVHDDVGSSLRASFAVGGLL